MNIFERPGLAAFLVLFFAALAFAACDSSSSDDDEEPQGFIWDYRGDNGPNHWASLSSEFALCGSGLQQSPIDITNDPIVDAPSWTFNYGTSTMKLFNDSVLMHVLIRQGSSIRVDGEVFDLKSFHFHTPGEHQIKGAAFEGEIHFVHQNAAGDYAMVAVLLQAGIENKDLSPLLSRFPIVDNETFEDPSLFVRAEDFLPANRTFFRYDGSLSRPPCSEGVTWIVLANPIDVSVSQLESLEDLQGPSNRPVQPLNGRIVVQD